MSFPEPFIIYSCDERAPQNIGAFVDLYLNHASDTGENLTHIFAREFRRKTHKILLFVLEECAENSENFRNSVLRKCCFFRNYTCAECTLCYGECCEGEARLTTKPNNLSTTKHFHYWTSGIVLGTCLSNSSLACQLAYSIAFKP